MPTFRADPLTPSCDNWCEFPVSDRPNAVAQFLEAAEADPSLIKVSSPGRIVTYHLFTQRPDFVWTKTFAMFW